ncbi:TPA: hypothetical protein ACGOYB_002096 [Streptococcus suis]
MIYYSLVAPVLTGAFFLNGYILVLNGYILVLNGYILVLNGNVFPV